MQIESNLAKIGGDGFEKWNGLKEGDGFETEQAARNWIKYKAQTWLGNIEKK
jgi:hypothetical protein